MGKILYPFVAVLLLCACNSQPVTVSIVPYPNDVSIGKGAYALDAQEIVCDSRTDARTQDAVKLFAGQLTAVTGKEFQVTVSDNSPSSGIRFIVDGSMPEEGYNLEVTRNGVEVRASQLAGFLFAIQSIKQMLPVAVYGNTPAPGEKWAIPCVTISDAPRFPYRGMHMDVARHFFSVEEVKRYLDIMAVHKLNILHWHLTDDQGWRIEIKRYPELTTVGSIRKKTVIRKEWENYDHTPYGGYFTQEEIRDIVDYAAGLAITVIPEIDLPGHMLAALTAYPHLGCSGGPYEVWGRWGVADEVLCAGKDEIFTFIEGVLTEVMELFPSEYIHIGGDECPKVYWQKCPACQAKIKQLGIKGDERYSAEHYLQSYVMSRVEKFLNAHGRRIIGWDEILEGDVAPSATIMSWRGTAEGIEAARLGHDVIWTPTSHFYFDYYQTLNTEDEPFGIGGYVPIEKVYSFEPMPAELTPEEQKHILGVQANLWTEYIADADHLEYMLLPRLAALSEVQWCNPGVRDWDRFVDNFRMDAIYNAMGYSYGKHIYGVAGDFEVDTDNGCILVTLSTQGDAPIYYTLDGSEPGPGSSRYRGPVGITGSCTFRAVAVRDGIDAPGYTREFVFSKSTARPIQLNSAPTPRYTYGAPYSLVDGYLGKPGYTTGAWVGFHADPMVVTIDMGGVSYSSVEIRALIEKEEWVFPPESIAVFTSTDGMDFKDAAWTLIEPLEKTAPDGMKDYEIWIPETDARYVQVVCRPVSSMPEWHGASGEKAHMFISEVAVN